MGGTLNREVECKLNAQNVRQLLQIRAYLLANPHYVSVIDQEFRHEALDGVELLGRPETLSAVRVRTYFDDNRLRGFRNGVEARIEPKGGAYKFTVKIGSNRPKDGKFLRNEHAVMMDTPAPDLELFDRDVRNRLRDIFDVKNLDKVELRPLIEIASQRWRFEYHPKGDPRTVIEYAHDVARGRTFTGFAWPLYQAELEMKKGSARYLRHEQARLQRTFNFLTRETRSKPSPGFDVLIRQLAGEKAQDYVTERLDEGKFRLHTRPGFARL